MIKVADYPIKVFFFCFCLVFAIFYFMMRTSTADVIGDAATLYAQGESAPTVFERQTSFNNALQLYLDLETKTGPRYSSGKLYYNIANTFYQLNEYPFAILYYTRAKALNNDVRIKENLQTVREKAHVRETKFEPSITDMISLREWVSLPLKLQLFSVAAITGFIFLSLWVWSENFIMKWVGLVFLILSAIFLLTVLVDMFFSPQDAVMVSSENLRKGASVEFASVLEEPIPAGSIVRVIGEEKNGSWLKVLYNDGKVGFVPGKSLRRV